MKRWICLLLIMIMAIGCTAYADGDLIPDDYGAPDNYDDLKKRYIALYEMYLEETTKDTAQVYASSVIPFFGTDTIASALGDDSIIVVTPLESTTSESIKSAINSLIENADTIGAICTVGGISTLKVQYMAGDNDPCFEISIDLDNPSNLKLMINPKYMSILQDVF